VCGQCSKHGTIVWEEPTPRTVAPKPKISAQPLKTQSRKPAEPTVDVSLELIENFDVQIRQAREKLGLTHKEIGKRINEKVSLLKKIETGKMTPDNKLAAKIEHALRVKLLVPASEVKIPQAKVLERKTRELTLGDLIQANKKGEEDKTERKPS
jgi:putative transcription factor